MTVKVSFSQPQLQDASGIVSLFNVVSPQHARSVAYWQWSNKMSPIGESHALIGKVDDLIVAHYSLMPVNFYVAGKSVTLGFGQQAVVLRKYRNLTIIKELMDRIQQESKARFDFLYAFPNDDFFPVKQRLLNWQSLGTFNANAIDVMSLPCDGIAGISVRELFSFKGMEWLGRDDGGVCLQKSAAYLNWRFFDHPVHHYVVLGAEEANKIVGYMVLKIYLRQNDNVLIGHLIDFDSDGRREDAIRALLAASRRFFMGYNINEVVFWNTAKAYQTIFDKIPHCEGFKTNFAVYFNSGANKPHILDLTQWSFSMAVSDSF